jgi:hypothetical protein
MMQELTYAFPILSWLVFLFVVIALIIWVKNDQKVSRETARAMSGCNTQGLVRSEVSLSMMQS